MRLNQIDSLRDLKIFQLIPISFWIGLFLILLLVILSLSGRWGRTSDVELLVMILGISGLVALIFAVSTNFPIHGDSYDWMQLVNTVSRSGSVNNPNSYMNWPIFWIFGAEFSLLTGLNVLLMFRILPVVFSIITTLLFYVAAREFFQEKKTPLYASLVFALVSFQIRLFPQGLSWTFFLISIYIFAKISKDQFSNRMYKIPHNLFLVFVILNATLTMEYPYSSLIFILILGSFVVSGYLSQRTRLFRRLSTGVELFHIKGLLLFSSLFWIIWIFFNDARFFVMPFNILMFSRPSIGSVPLVSVFMLSGIHVITAFIFRVVLYASALIGLVFLMREKKRVLELVSWFLVMSFLILVAQFIFGGLYPFEPLRFEVFMLIPAIMFVGYALSSGKRKITGSKVIILVLVVLCGLTFLNQLYVGTDIYTDLFFSQDETAVNWMNIHAFKEAVLVSDYRMSSFFSYSNTRFNVISNRYYIEEKSIMFLSRSDVVGLFTEQQSFQIGGQLNTVSGIRDRYNASIYYLVADQIQLKLYPPTNQPYSRQVLQQYDKTPVLNKIFDNAKIVIYSNERATEVD